ncbi:MerR family transcriptional regulator [Galactobacter valiniphilus]|uniref:MerR family transcriptional regulator n=1 Tax=Galactobacter valiniphilus TaxID=2676122 RepID=UPI003735CF71
MDHAMRDVVRASGVTSRTLRHYESIGLLLPSSTAAGGERRYDSAALLRLQRILVLRSLGLGLPAIKRALAAGGDELEALREHADQLVRERERLETRLAAVRHSIAARENGRDPQMSEMFKGYDHRQYEQEVEQRWGKDSTKRSNEWWESMSQEKKDDFQHDAAALGQAWTDAAAAGWDPQGAAAQALAERHLDWLRGIPGTPAAGGGEDALRAYVLGLADMYVADPRFAANYGGASGAQFVRAALRSRFGVLD